MSEVKADTPLSSADFEPKEIDAKEQAIIEAARKVFLSNGFDGASMDTIALTAGVSKRTVYNRFESKEALFGSAIEETCRRILPVNLEQFELSLPPKEFVDRFAHVFVKAILEPEAIALRRIAVFEASRKPSLGVNYLEHSLYFMVDAFSKVIERFNARGIVKAEDARLAICQLGALITEPLYTEVVLGAIPDDLDAAIDKQITSGLDAFWRIYGADEQDAG